MHALEDRLSDTKRPGLSVVAGLALCIAVTACDRTPTTRDTSPFVAHTTATGPSPEVDLGWRLFFSPKLSADGTISCASCHQPDKGLSNGAAIATGIQGRTGRRNVPTIFAVKNSPTLFWDGRAQSLEEQVLEPIQNPTEMGANLPDVLARLNEDPIFRRMFQAVYGGPATASRMAKAIAAFERAITANQSPFDRFLAGELFALNDQQLRGWITFQGRGRCITCHTLPDFTDHQFHNLGIGTQAEHPDIGRQAVTGQTKDWAAFKTPTLRNVAKTAPYMHNGALPSLNAVLGFYERGGTENANRDLLLSPLHLLPDDREDMLAFLNALSSPDNLKDLTPLPQPEELERP